MTREQLLQRISIDPNVCFGKPCIRGTRIWVSLILDLLASGMSEAEVINEYPVGCRVYKDKQYFRQVCPSDTVGFLRG